MDCLIHGGKKHKIEATLQKFELGHNILYKIACAIC